MPPQQFPVGTRIDPQGNAIFPAGTKIGPDGSIVTGETTPTQTGQPPRSTAQNLGLGILKGVASTAIGGAELVNKGMSAIGLSDPIKPEVFEAARSDLATPEGTAQNIGFGVEQIAEFMIPFGGPARAVAAVPRAGRAVRGLVRAGGEAAEFAGKSAVQSGGDADAVVSAALFGGATPAVIGTARAVGRVAGDLLPQRLYTQIFKIAKDDWTQAIRTQARGQTPNPTLAREVLDRGLRGSATNMAIYAVRKLESLEQQVQQLVRGGMGPSGAPSSTAMPTIVLDKKRDVINVLRSIQSAFGRTFFSERAQEAGRLASMLQGVRGDQVRTMDALAVRRFLDKMRNTSSFRTDPKLSAKQEELKGAADLIRNTLRQDDRFAKLMNDERVMIEAFDRIVEYAVRTDNKKLLGLTDYVLGGGGFAAGWGVSGIGIAASVRGFQQPFTLTNLGYSLDRFYKIAPSAEPVARGAASVGAASGSR